MAESGLFIGWGDIRTGRDAAANKVFAEALAYWPTLQAAGEIESFAVSYTHLTLPTIYSV